MSVDRELLELAAKAAGLEVHAAWQKDRDAAGKGDVGLWLTNGTTCWNPLTDDGQALRLAVKMRLHIEQYRTIRAYKLAPGGFWINGCEPIGDDPCAATRRAITRAAAEIGRAMA